MKKLFTFIILIYLPILLSGQTVEEISYNLGFETINKATQYPTKWMVNPNPGYTICVDSIIKFDGKYSLRIESTSKRDSNSYAFVGLIVPVDFKCKQIELKTKMKLSNVAKGVANFGISLFTDTTVFQNKDISDKSLTGSADWKEYSLIVPFNPNSKNCYISIQFTGTGRIWFDDFQLLLDGEDYYTSAKRIGYNAKLDKEFDSGSHLEINSINKNIISNLTTLAKVWGFLKYYHPYVAEGKYNWDYELFRIMPEIIHDKNIEERNTSLSKWISKIGKPDSIQKPLTIDSTTVKMFPDLNWIEDKNDLGSEIPKQLDFIRRAKRESLNYFVDLGSSLNAKFQNEDRYNSMKYPDTGFRILSLFRFWNMIQYFSPYKYLIDEDWNKVLPEFIPKFINIKSETEYRLVVLELLTHVHDTHASITADDEILNNYKGNNFVPIEVSFVENKLIVTNFLNKEIEQKSELRKGDIILNINSENIKSIINKRLKFTPASNYPTQLRNIARDILRTNENQMKIKYESDGVIKTKLVDCIPYDIMTYYNAFMVQKGNYSQLINNNIGYFNLGCKRNEDLSKIMAGFKNTKGIIIDLRSMPEIGVLDNFGEFLMPERREFAKLTNTNIQTPGLFSYRYIPKEGRENKDYYKGRLIILVNENSQSRAEYYAMAFHAVPNCIIIGSTTAGADGDISPILLPGGITTMISGLGVYYPDGKETQRIGIIPDIEIKPTIKGIKENRDELLDKAVKIINDSK